jgi:hypothetical protein
MKGLKLLLCQAVQLGSLSKSAKAVTRHMANPSLQLQTTCTALLAAAQCASNGGACISEARRGLEEVGAEEQVQRAATMPPSHAAPAHPSSTGSPCFQLVVKLHPAASPHQIHNAGTPASSHAHLWYWLFIRAIPVQRPQAGPQRAPSARQRGRAVHIQL